MLNPITAVTIARLAGEVMEVDWHAKFPMNIRFLRDVNHLESEDDSPYDQILGPLGGDFGDQPSPTSVLPELGNETACDVPIFMPMHTD
ncbi:hypothetical protein PVK06_002547 [Gossypium arboreum]|uniref:Uncharacterized protein n=1 Tax=Gossypium arboreum TaxID=29729 RepID=A0ABR0R3X5_GOSAR|nr:hypothetical protein PVK06_002547 [Gossypium arboreum]